MDTNLKRMLFGERGGKIGETLLDYIDDIEKLYDELELDGFIDQRYIDILGDAAQVLIDFSYGTYEAYDKD